VSPQQSSHSASRPLAAIILAAGKGTRMESDLPKVVHPVADRPMVAWVVHACRAVGASPIVLVIGHGADSVRDAFAGDDADLLYAVQEPQLGTGHAVEQARRVFADAVEDTDVLVLCGDGPLIRAETLRTLINAHRRSNAVATLATAVINDATGYGRIVRDHAGRFQRIVEHRDASNGELAICEINPSYYCFRARPLFDMLKLVTNDNAKGEYYLTDVFPMMLERGMKVEVVDAVPAEDVLSINTPAQLAEIDAILRSRLSVMESAR
jgi:bifunctional UDP-N-acetylglucosamine pyrophosphorylase / glucosamine-1-phosphate N-acetyltransferase